MCPAIELSLDVRIKESTNGFGVQQPGDGLAVDFAIMIVGAAQTDQHVFVAAIIADALNETASVDIRAIERSEFHGASILNVDRFGVARVASATTNAIPILNRESKVRIAGWTKAVVS
jgi:hypothetical protein